MKNTKNMRAVFLTLFSLLIILPIFANAQASQKAESFVENRVQETLNFVGDSSISMAEKKAKFEKMLNASFDMKTVARFALGRFWRKLPKSDQARYYDLFENYIVNVYAQRFDEYSGQKFNVTGSRAEQNGDYIVFSELRPDKGANVFVDWRIREKGGQLKVIDVIVEGISMSVTQRSDFASVIQRNGGDISALLDFLDKQIVASKN
jgi:phospholipid transport system substrate-binding protein